MVLKKYGIKIIGAVVCLLLLMDFQVNKVQAKENQKVKSLIVLLDTSESMKTNGFDEEAKQWAAGLCAICEKTEIELSLILFESTEVGDQIDFAVKQKKIGQSQFEETVDKIEEEPFDGQKTDHYEAIKKAEECLPDGMVDHSVIVLLSDGDLDITGNKEVAEKKFIEECKKLSEGNCSIFLIDFGKKLKLFEQFSKDGKEETKGIFYDPKITLDELTGKIWDKMGYEVIQDSGQIDQGKIPLTISKKYFKIILNIGLENANENVQDITIRKNEREYTDFTCQKATGSMFIFLNEPSAGKYEIIVPWLLTGTYGIKYQNDISEMEIKSLMLLKKNGEKEELEDGKAYQVDFSTTELDVEVILNNNLNGQDVREFGYRVDGGDLIDQIWNDGIKNTIKILVGESISQMRADIEGSRTHTYTIEMKANDYESSKSFTIEYQTEMIYSNSGEPIVQNVKAMDSIDLREYLKNQKFVDEELFITVGEGEEFRADFPKETDSFKYKQMKLTFKKECKSCLVVLRDGKGIYEEIECKVNGTNWLNKIKSFFKLL